MTSDTLQFLKGTLLLIGAIIGVGMFGIPSVFAKAGIVPGIILLFFLLCLTTLFHLMYGEIVLRTNAFHHLPGYVAMYLGKQAGRLALATTTIGLAGTLFAYLLLGGTFISGLVHIDLYWGYAIFLLAGVAFLLFDGQKEAVIGSVLSVLLVGTILLFVGGILPAFSFQSFVLFNAHYAFLPYGVLIFALSGSFFIPDLAGAAGGKFLKKSLIWGTIIPALLYCIFAVGVVGVSGAGTSDDALSGLAAHFGRATIVLGELVGLFAVFTSSLSASRVLKEALAFDMGVSGTFSWVVPIAVPAALALIFHGSYIQVIAFIGGILLGLDMVLIALTFDRARTFSVRIPEYTLGIPRALVFVLVGLLLLGVAYEAAYFLIPK